MKERKSNYLFIKAPNIISDDWNSRSEEKILIELLDISDVYEANKILTNCNNVINGLTSNRGWYGTGFISLRHYKLIRGTAGSNHMQYLEYDKTNGELNIWYIGFIFNNEHQVEVLSNLTEEQALLYYELN